MADELQATQWAVMWETAQWRNFCPCPCGALHRQEGKNVFIFKPEFIFYIHSLQGSLFFITVSIISRIGPGSPQKSQVLEGYRNNKLSIIFFVGISLVSQTFYHWFLPKTQKKQSIPPSPPPVCKFVSDVGVRCLLGQQKLSTVQHYLPNIASLQLLLSSLVEQEGLFLLFWSALIPGEVMAGAAGGPGLGWSPMMQPELKLPGMSYAWIYNRYPGWERFLACHTWYLEDRAEKAI